MLRVVLAFAGVAWTLVVVWTTACSVGATLMEGVTEGQLASTWRAGLMVIGEADLATDVVGAVVVGTGWAGIVDLLGAGLIGDTFMDDIMTTGGGGVVAGTVLTTTAALDLAGSSEEQKRERDHICRFSCIQSISYVCEISHQHTLDCLGMVNLMLCFVIIQTLPFKAITSGFITRARACSNREGKAGNRGPWGVSDFLRDNAYLKQPGPLLLRGCCRGPGQLCWHMPPWTCRSTQPAGPPHCSNSRLPLLPRSAS